MEILSNLPEEYSRNILTKFDTAPVKLLDYLVKFESTNNLVSTRKILVLIGNMAGLKASTSTAVYKNVRIHSISLQKKLFLPPSNLKSDPEETLQAQE